MMSGRITFLVAILGAGLAVAAAAAAPQTKSPAPGNAPDAQTKQLLQNCDAHKFETVVHQVVDGQPQQSKVKLCGKEGQTDAEWIGTLKDAITKLNANKQMPAPLRDQIVTALNAEIARLQHPAPLLPSSPAAKTSMLDGLTPLPPLVQPKQSGTVALPLPRRTAPSAPADEYAALPPLPASPPPPTHVLGLAAGASLEPLPRPRMSFVCFEPGQAEGPCTGFTRDTLLTVRAGEDLPASTSLRFVRDGDPKADVDLAQLKRGKSVQLTVPVDVCRHAVGGKLELRIVRAGQEVGSEGPYNLNC